MRSGIRCITYWRDTEISVLEKLKISDIDIGILPKNECYKKKLTILKEKLEDMNIPYKVEVVDISKVSQIFREKALKEGKVWKS